MRLALSVFAAAALSSACATQRGPADEVPPTAPTQGQEPIQQVPSEPGGPATIIGEPGSDEDADTNDGGTR